MNGQIEFALYLMRHMRGEATIARTLASLGLATVDLDAAAARVAASVDFYDLRPHPLDAYVRLIGAPTASALDPACMDSESFAGSICHRFHLEPWPDLDFLLRAHPKGWVFGPEFVRRAGTRPSLPASPRLLLPWSAVESEVIDRFGPFAGEDAWNHGKEASYLLDGVEITLSFDFSLLQTIGSCEVAGS